MMEFMLWREDMGGDRRISIDPARVRAAVAARGGTEALRFLERALGDEGKPTTGAGLVAAMEEVWQQVDAEYSPTCTRCGLRQLVDDLDSWQCSRCKKVWQRRALAEAKAREGMER